MALPTSSITAPQAAGIARVQMPALAVGVAGVVIAAIGYFTSAVEFYRAWLPAFIFWFLIAVGSLGILMLQYVTGGEWGVILRRPLGAAARTIPLFVLFGIPIAVGLPHIYIWANAEIVKNDHLLHLNLLHRQLEELRAGRQLHEFDHRGAQGQLRHVQPADLIGRDDAVRPGALDPSQGFHHDSLLIEPAVECRSFNHGVFAAHMINGKWT